jgi:hypothetical protein
MNNLKSERKARRLSSRVFTIACGIPLTRYMLIEQGDIEPTPLELSAIQKVLDTNPIDRDWRAKLRFLSDAEKKLLKWNDDIRAMSKK